MKVWLEAVISALAATTVGALSMALKHVWTRQKAQAAQQEAIKDGMLALLHDRIYGGYAICEQQGCATVDDIKNLEYLYRPYHALGGNSTGTELYERIKKMPPAPITPVA
jgi:hypothetical protein